MEKTIGINMNETKMALIKACNESGLPLCILELIVKDIYEEIRMMSGQQLQNEAAEYYKSLEANKEEFVPATDEETVTE